MPGRTVSEAVVIPNNTIYQGSYVYVVEHEILRRKDVDVAWQDDAEAIIAGGLQVGDELVLTPLGQVTSGIRVTTEASQSARSESREAAQ